jgi:hypothetical protein
MTPTQPLTARRKLRAAIVTGQPVRVSHIRRARQAHAKRPADQPAQRMAARCFRIATFRHTKRLLYPPLAFCAYVGRLESNHDWGAVMERSDLEILSVDELWDMHQKITPMNQA